MGYRRITILSVFISIVAFAIGVEDTICLDCEGVNKYYCFHTVPETFENAKLKCNGKRNRLATILSEQEQRCIKYGIDELHESLNRAWWTSGKEVSNGVYIWDSIRQPINPHFQYWAPNQDPRPQHPNCISLRISSANDIHNWYRQGCNFGNFYVCERPKNN